MPEPLENLDRIRTSCQALVKRRAAVSAGAAMVPVPGVDIAADIGLLMELIPTINRKFGLTPQQIEDLDPRHKALVYAMLKKVGTDLVGKAISKKLVIAALKKVGLRMATKQVVKYVPFAGQAAAAALSMAAMMYVGNSHIDDCYNVARGARSK